jgi:hypothetical protein
MRTALFAVLCVLVLGATDTSAATPRAHVPKRGHTLVLVGQDAQTEDTYVRETGGRVPAGFMNYIFLEDEPATFAQHLADIKSHADKYPGSVLQFGVTMGRSAFWSATQGDPGLPGALQVTAGGYDTQLDLLAAWLKTLDHTAYLRVGYEFDLLGGQWGTPDQYKQGYRYIVDRLRSRHVRNALYVWHSSGAFFKTLDRSGVVGVLGTMDYTPGDQGDPLLEALDAQMSDDATGRRGDLQPITDYYPGRAYVDLFAISYWDDAYGFGRSSERARALYRKRTQEILDQAKAMGLPLMIGESTPVYIGFDSHADSIAWLRRYFDLIERNDLRALSLIVPDWPNIDGGYWGQAYWNGYWPDARVHHFADARSYWFERLTNPRYVESTDS